jgi:cardiolipin synthase
VEPAWAATALFLADWIIRIGFSLRVVMRRPSVGVALAWLVVILVFPFVGAGVYLALGEPRLGRARAARASAARAPFRAWREGLRERYGLGRGEGDADGDGLPDGTAGLARLIESVIGSAPLPGNALELLTDAESIFRALIHDVDEAARACDLEFYIWSAGGLADELAAALARASERGVACRVLLDAMGSAAFLRRGGGVERLRDAGVRVAAALPVGLARAGIARPDLRLHRKIAVIDGKVAYTGSQNVADPRYFKQGAGVGAWVDAMARLRGPAVEALAATFAEDWAAETGAIEPAVPGPGESPLPRVGRSIVQVTPSGPDLPPARIRAILLETIYAARDEVVLTTPYFVPDETLLVALASASARGAAVTLVLPARNDSKLVDLASRAFQGDLAEAGVGVRLFGGGLLHTKSITVDGRFSLFGSLNLDPRSLQLNFEITLAVYDPGFTAGLRALQQSYIEASDPLDLAAWRARPFGTRLAENAARLAGPLL